MQLINFEQVVTPFPVAARQIELVAPAGCAYVRSGNVLVNSASWDYRPANGGLVELVFVGQYVAGGYIHARYNIGVSFGGAPGTQPASIVDATRLVLSPVTRFSACDIAAYALL